MKNAKKENNLGDIQLYGEFELDECENKIELIVNNYLRSIPNIFV
jgi:hypothetical protein